MKSFQDILKGFREGSITEREKGGKFERLMKGYLLTSPIYVSNLKTVWMWGEFPYRSQNLAVGYNKERDTATVQISHITFDTLERCGLRSSISKRVIDVNRVK